MILSLPTKTRRITERPSFYQKTLKKVNNNVTYFGGCVIEILPDGKYKVFGETCDTHIDACMEVIKWKAKHEARKQQVA